MMALILPRSFLYTASGLSLRMNRLVGRDLDDVELIGVAELLLLGQRGTGHAGQLAVQAEVVLEGDGREGLALVLDL